MPRPIKVLPPETMKEFEKDFRAGLMPWKALCKKYGVGTLWIKRQQNELGLTRDLTECIKTEAVKRDHERIFREIARESANKESAAAFQADPERKATEREVTEANAELIARVTGSHRALLSRQRAIVSRLLDELEFAADARPELKALAEEMRANGAKSDASWLLALLDRSGRIDDAKKLSETIKTIVMTEREVLRIGEGGGRGDTSLASLIDRVMGTGFKPVEERHDG